MANALLISLVGMGLVFLSILLLWGLMALLVRLTRDPEPVAEVAAALPAADTAAEPASTQALVERKRRAAAAAVAVAMALHKTSLVKTAPAAPQHSLSAWQAVQRAGQLSQRVQFARKKGSR
jgi:Na+-transporting methylmalonyl-CoA/oxaloacetate decarboxylase gamma subunit